jgi:hypothetical protein
VRVALDLREASGRGDMLRDEGERHDVQGQAGCRALHGPFGRHGVCRQLHELLRCLWLDRLRDDDHDDTLRRKSPAVEPVLQRHV